jgi:molybdopterin/thiamine biosynthesis adenylyltransferase
MIGPSYPDGPIKFYPDKVSGVTHTFHHQNYNRENLDIDWRSGDPCLNSSKVSWGRKDYSVEPRESMEKLRWHLLRCKDWILAASTNSLVQPGDPFEFPALPSKTLYRIVFNEDALSFQNWASSGHREGIVELKTLNQLPKVYVVSHFIRHQQDIPEIKWGNQISLTEEQDQTAIWLMLNTIPVMAPWQIPETFADLLRVCADQGYDLRKETSSAYLKIRKKEKVVRFVMIGFPVTKTIGDPASLIHWLAFELPNPSIKGFKKNSIAQFSQELNVLMTGSKKIKWVTTENWNKEQLTARGLLPQSLSKAKILLIGCGAVGSILAEQLVRMGSEAICVVDDETLTAGNLSRHTLSLKDIGQNKAEALSNRLNSIFPFVKATFKPKSIQESLEHQSDFFADFDLVFDATADDSTLKFISAHLSSTEKTFISISLGFKADRLFCFFHKKNESKSIDVSFHESCGPWLQKEAKDFPNTPDVVEGIGCWHPLFPSRLDDILMLIGAAIKIVEAELQSCKTESFTVIEKQYDHDNNFSGIKVIKP